jgi:hypothetical protein
MRSAEAGCSETSSRRRHLNNQSLPIKRVLQHLGPMWSDFSLLYKVKIGKWRPRYRQKRRKWLHLKLRYESHSRGPPIYILQHRILRRLQSWKGLLVPVCTPIRCVEYAHLLSFGTFDDSYKVSVGDVYGQFEFDKFKRLSDKFKKVISIGGWDFSTFPTHYHFFRNGVLPGNRQKLANSLADFVKDHNLDGINIDWEYPSVGVSFGS